jgi:MarR family transcriptional regulator, organic hydroperoxide resistance regulator
MSTTAVTTTAEVVQAFDSLFATARRARARAGALDGGLTLSQAQLLEPLTGGETRGAGELALAAGVSRPTATRMLDALEREGVVTRERAADDRRCVHVALTGEGEDRLRAASAERIAWRERIFADLSPSERAETARVLTRLSALIEEHTS